MTNRTHAGVYFCLMDDRANLHFMVSKSDTRHVSVTSPSSEAERRDGKNVFVCLDVCVLERGLGTYA